jgi:hypothetical protein
MRSQINLVRAAADPRSRRSLGEQNGGSASIPLTCPSHSVMSSIDVGLVPADDSARRDWRGDPRRAQVPIDGVSGCLHPAAESLSRIWTTRLGRARVITP